MTTYQDQGERRAMTAKPGLKAYDPSTGEEFESWGALVAAKASGYVVAVMMSRHQPRRGVRYFTRVFGTFDDKITARSAAAKARRDFHLNPENSGTTLLAVTVEPLWHHLDFNPKGKTP